MLVFEDIHWADDALLDFIDLLADRAGAIPLLIACTARPELLERREHWGGGKTNATTISLTPLADEETARLVAELLGQAVLPVAVQETLLERSSVIRFTRRSTSECCKTVDSSPTETRVDAQRRG